MSKITVVKDHSWLRLVKHTSDKGRIHYSVEVRAYKHPGVNNMDHYAELRQEWHRHFDPHNNRGSKYSLKWKYRSREVAEQLILLALMKWGI